MMQKQNSITYLALPGLTQAGAIHAFVGRQGGVSEGEFESLNLGRFTADRPSAVAENEQRFRRAFGIRKLIRARQVHGREVVVVDRPVENESEWGGHEADVLVTDQPGVALAVLTADCVPVVLFDPVRKVAGIAHAGWRGVCLRAPAAGVETMERRFGSRPEEMLAGIGPGIGDCCYEVDGPVIQAVAETFGRAAEPLLVPAGEGKMFFNLGAAIVRILVQAGLAPARIEQVDLCTSCRADLFFSHRRDRGRTGRQINFVRLPA